MLAAAARSIYIHFPYCHRLCPYCDFNKYVAQSDNVSQRELTTAFVRELERWAGVLSASRRASPIASVYFGGGTPSLAPVAFHDAVLTTIRRCFDVDAQCEVTCEANPTDAETSKLRDLRAAGVNRLSLGVQSFKPAELEFLGRNHSRADAIAAVETATRLFDRVRCGWLLDVVAL